MKTKAAPQWLDLGTYKEPIPNTDNILVPQIQLDNSSTYIDKDGSGNMTFTDAVTGTKTLAQLGGGGGDMTKAVYDPQDEGAIRLTPRASSSGAEGTMFYSSDDNHVWVATE